MPPHHDHPHHHAHPWHHAYAGRGMSDSMFIRASRWQPPLPTARDCELLDSLVADRREARAIGRLLETCPPEVAAIACLVLRVYERTGV